MEKQEMYSLYVQLVNSDRKVYSLFEGKSDESKRGGSIMNHTSMKGLDDLTAGFDSFEEINTAFKELYNTDKDMYRPVIYVDKDVNDLSKSYYTTDIVYSEDAKRLEDKDNIKVWLLDYLRNHPENIEHFGLLRKFYVDVKKRAPIKSVEYCLKIAVEQYLQKYEYMAYRDMYFKLKQFDGVKEKKDEIYR